MDISLFAAPLVASNILHSSLADLSATLREAAHPMSLSTPDVIARGLRTAAADLRRAADTLDHGASLVEPTPDEPPFNPYFHALTILDRGDSDPRDLISTLAKASKVIAGSKRHHLDDPAIRLIVLKLAHVYRVGGKIPQLDFDRLTEKCAGRCETFVSNSTDAKS